MTDTHNLKEGRFSVACGFGSLVHGRLDQGRNIMVDGLVGSVHSCWEVQQRNCRRGRDEGPDTVLRVMPPKRAISHAQECALLIC